MNRLFDSCRLIVGPASLLLAATSLAAATTPATQPAPPSVEIAAGYQAALQSTYGAREGTVLRSYILDSTSDALKAVHGECNLNLDIVLERAAPTHPTMKQQMDDPALDPFRSVFVNGGAGTDRLHTRRRRPHARDSEGRLFRRPVADRLRRQGSMERRPTRDRAVHRTSW